MQDKSKLKHFFFYFLLKFTDEKSFSIPSSNIYRWFFYSILPVHVKHLNSSATIIKCMVDSTRINFGLKFEVWHPTSSSVCSVKKYTKYFFMEQTLYAKIRKILVKKKRLCKGGSQTTLTRFSLFDHLPAFVYTFYLIKEDDFDYPPTSPCKRNLWTTPKYQSLGILLI